MAERKDGSKDDEPMKINYYTFIEMVEQHKENMANAGKELDRLVAKANKFEKHPSFRVEYYLCQNGQVIVKPIRKRFGFLRSERGGKK